MDVSEALAARREMVEMSRGYVAEAGRVWDRITPEARRAIETARRQVEDMRDGELYFVNDEMTRIAATAGATLPVTAIEREELPSPTGVMIYDAPVMTTSVLTKPDADGDEMPIVGFLWGQAERYGSAPGVMIAPISTDGTRLSLLEAEGRTIARGWPYGEAIPEGMVPDPDAQVLRATWLLMSQRLAATETEQVPRAERRRCEKAGVPSTVNVVRVRKHEQRPTDGARDVEWSHRWLVAGHWRRQWCPSVGAHRPTWIAGHVKGPAEKPLVLKDRVTTWIR